MPFHIMEGSVSVATCTFLPPLESGQVAVEVPHPASDWLPVPDGGEESGYRVEAAPPPPPVVPRNVTPLQIRKAIRVAGLKPAVDAYIATLDPDGAELEAWEFATAIDRADPFVALAASGLGLSDADVDALFILASQQS